MIIRKRKNKMEWEYDTDTNMYLNHITNKWVANPRHQRGKFIGNTIGYSKDVNYKSTYSTLCRLNPTLHEPTFTLPYHITDDMMVTAMKCISRIVLDIKI